MDPPTESLHHVTVHMLPFQCREFRPLLSRVLPAFAPVISCFYRRPDSVTSRQQLSKIKLTASISLKSAADRRWDL